jgi:signal transduction histidine kinase/DNA-binding response OmpR family regulator
MLIVHLEDESPLREILRVALVAVVPDSTLISLTNSDEAMEYIQQNVQNIDLYILDIRVPGSIDGMEVAHNIRDLGGYGVVAITSAYRAPDESFLNNLDVQWFAKPWNIMELLDKLLSPVQQNIQVPADVESTITRNADSIVRTSSFGSPRRFTIITSDLQKGVRVQEDFLRHFDNDAYIVSSEEFRTKLSQNPTECILVFSDDLDQILLKKIQEFDLSSSAVLIVIEMDHTLTWEVYVKWLRMGIDDFVLLRSLSKDQPLFRLMINRLVSPALIRTSKSWQVIVASPDFDQRTDIADFLEATFFAVAIDADSPELCLELAEEERPNLLLIDQALDNMALVRDLRERGIMAPVILLAPGFDLLSAEHYELNIRGIIPYAHIQDGLVPTIERLLRSRVSRRSTQESFADYRIRASESEFEQSVRQDLSLIAATLDETGKLFSGLIHDLRNALFSLSSQLEDILEDTDTDATNHLDTATFLLETIAEGRFKAVWRLKEISEDELILQFQDAIALVQPLYPTVTIQWEDAEKTTSGNFLIDPGQTRQLTACLLMIALSHTNTLTVSFQESMLSITGDGLSDFTPDLESMNLNRETGLHTLVMHKLAMRLGAMIEQGEDRITVKFQAGGWPTEQQMRLQIAKDADQIETLEEQLAAIPQSEAVPQVKPLVEITALQLAQTLQQVTQQIASLVPDATRINMVGRYAVLLAYNLLTTSAGYSFTPTSVDLQNALDTLQAIRADYLKHCAIDFSVAPETPPALANELALLQILVNLVTNAVEAMDGRGRLTIRAAPHNGGVEIRVSDNGPGIPADIQERIFDLFYTTKRGHERGVGLHIVASLVKQLNGAITLDSTVGRGTTFIITIPTAQEDNHA